MALDSNELKSNTPSNGFKFGGSELNQKTVFHRSLEAFSDCV